eukprot:CAMPEP_0116884806 /NCGR_PEP_ID=MMETSP0463-20121206/17827_1 /TAXON_ID=181622 /ORGANISM="Strombidinopsis sp, Strain SopsisLIS2011" /LENGTH=69 /DNA_ID=CAMNT_0004541937 /DNA_START=523 /DNA_END=729 /DNA_ORIENTATION=-
MILLQSVTAQTLHHSQFLAQVLKSKINRKKKSTDHKEMNLKKKRNIDQTQTKTMMALSDSRIKKSKSSM